MEWAMSERTTCKRCGDPIQCDSYYPYCSEYCEDRAMNPEGDDEERSYGTRLRDGFRTLRRISDSNTE